MRSINNNNLIKSLSITLLILNLSACNLFNNEDGAPIFPVDVSHIKEPVPKVEPKSKYGNPETYSVFGKKYKTMQTSNNFSQTGIASWYGTKFHGRKTSSGEVYDMYALTGAHKSLPLPTYAKVTNLDNNKSIVIKINDRGPFHDDRIIDLSYAAAAKLGVLHKGTANVKLSAINPENNSSKPSKLKKQELVNLQIGAFTERQNAEQLIKSVANVINHPIKITTANNITNDSKQTIGALFKVHLGPVPSEKLSYIKDKLANINIKNPIVISAL